MVEAASKTSAVTVVLRGGTYFLTSPLSFGSADSGSPTMPTTWQAYPCETPVVSGGAAVTGWKKGSANLWTATLPSSTVPFESLFVNGERRLRSRVQSTQGVGFAMQGGKCVAVNPPAGSSASAALADCNLGTFLRMAATVTPGTTGCPFASYQGASKCLDRFEYAEGDPIAEWTNLNGTYDSTSPAHPCKTDPKNPYPVGDVEITDFNAWTVDVMRVGCVDTGHRIVYFTGAAFGSSGTSYPFVGPETQHRYVVENAKDAFESETASGQTGLWFLDRSHSPWVLSYVANAGEDPSTDTIVIPQVTAPIVGATGLSSVTFRGITFEMDNYVPGASGFNDDTNGENTLPGAVACEGCANVDFDGITVRRTSSSGLQIGAAGPSPVPGAPGGASCSLPAGGLAKPACVVVENSAFYDLGDSGIHVGHAPTGDDDDDTVVQFVRVENDLIQGYSRVFADGEGLAQGNGHDILYTHNDVDDGYHAALSICELGCPSKGGSDFNVVASYNHLWNLLQGITSDGGSLYYNTGNGGGTKAPPKTAAGNQVLHNRIHDTTDASILDKNGVINVSGSGYGGEGIYLDNQTGDVRVEDNVVYRVSAHSMWISAGPGAGIAGNTIKNNIFAYGREAGFVLSSAWPQGCGVTPALRVTVTNNLFFFDRNEHSSPTLAAFYPLQGCAYPCSLPFDQFELFTQNLYWGIGPASGFASDDRQFHVDQKTTPATLSNCQNVPPSDWTYMSFAEWQDDPTLGGTAVTMLEDEGGVIADPGFAHPEYPADDYTLKASPVAGFDSSQTNDTMTSAGRSSQTLTAPTVARTFPTYVLDPASGF
jgi:hypothetical protein